MKYKHLFFDLDHTLWDFEANSHQTLEELYHSMKLGQRGVHDFNLFHKNYLIHNDKLWDRYRNGYIKVDELRWKRMWLTLLDFKIADEPLAREMGGHFLDLLPTRKTLFPYTFEFLDTLAEKIPQHNSDESIGAGRPRTEWLHQDAPTQCPTVMTGQQQ